MKILIAIFILLGIQGASTFNYYENTSKIKQMDEIELKTFNTKFEEYEGDEVRGTIVNSLLQAVIAHNLAQDDTSRQVEVVFSDSINIEPISQEDTTAPKVETGEMYQVKCEKSQEGEDKGLVYCILITKQGDTEPQPIHTE